ncbi:MAG TPA: hypothetical protein VHE30_25195 [Polyangiaceae bacterium]|nr:hypothetical protein [Polyangiaceae bacterium]
MNGPDDREREDRANGSTDAEGADDVLRRIASALFRHPAATQAAFSALVAEGRSFARTPEGARLARALARSDVVARGRMIWEVLGMSAFQEHGSGLPTVLVDEFARVAELEGLETALSRVFERGMRP